MFFVNVSNCTPLLEQLACQPTSEYDYIDYQWFMDLMSRTVGLQLR